MKIKRVLSVLLVSAMVSAMFAGCSASMKTARVAGKFGTALKQQPITSATAEISCGLTKKEDGSSTVSRFHTVVHSRSDWEEERSYSDISSSITVGDVELKDQMQSYASGESGEEVRYVHVDSMDTWVRLENRKRVVDIDPGLILMLLEKVAQDTTIDSKDDTVGGNTHYVLQLCFTGEDFLSFAQEAGLSQFDEFQNCDLTEVRIPVVLEIEDKTFLPISLQVKVEGINETVITALARAFAKGKEIENVEVSMDEISLLITNFGYGPQDIPMLPKGAAENALDMKKVKEIQN